MVKGGIIKLRTQQRIHTQANDDQVTIFAPLWVKKALAKIYLELKNAKFEIEPPSGKYIHIENKLSLLHLLALARNEQCNTTGVIKFNQYKNIPKQTVIALRDLAKHCVIVGKDIAKHYGGYPENSAIHPLNQEVIICDLAGLQFQDLHNTGRHVLVSARNTFPEGALDKEIYLSTVGEDKPTYQQAKQDKTGRFIQGSFKGKSVLFDVKAYQAFVIQDFILAATAVNEQAKAHPAKDINFKFLKYGAGFFADGLDGKARKLLSENLTLAVLKGLEQLCNLPVSARSQIKRIELPFYAEKNNKKIDNILAAIEKLCQKNHIEFSSAAADALKPTSDYVTATTNCADPHAVTGNEMNYGSVDAAIAENLKRKGNNFSPICNPKMQEKFVHLAYQVEDDYQFDQNIKLSSASTFAHLKWSALAGLFCGTAVKAGLVASIGFSGTWFAAFAVAMTVMIGLEVILRIFDHLQCSPVMESSKCSVLDNSNHHQKKANDEQMEFLSCNKTFELNNWRHEKRSRMKNKSTLSNAVQTHENTSCKKSMKSKKSF